MVIQAHKSPLELILALHVRDKDGNLLPRIVYLDTDNMVAKQYRRVCIDNSFVELNEVEISEFAFHTTALVTESTLRSLLPSELHYKIVVTKK
jgi:hypothetical protein